MVSGLEELHCSYSSTELSAATKHTHTYASSGNAYDVEVVEIFEDGPLHLDGFLVLIGQVDHEVEEVALPHVVWRLLQEDGGCDGVVGPVRWQCVCVCVCVCVLRCVR